MRGFKRPDGSYTGTLPQILSLGGFRAKALVTSGDCDQEEEQALGGKFLGVSYSPQEDLIHMEIRTKVRARHQKQQRGKATSFVSLDEAFVDEVEEGSKVLTRRKVLSMIMSQYDLLGLLAPLLLQAKLLMRELYGKGCEISWDSPIPAAQAAKWGP